jgi:hypothetical protein
LGLVIVFGADRRFGFAKRSNADLGRPCCGAGRETGIKRDEGSLEQTIRSHCLCSASHRTLQTARDATGIPMKGHPAPPDASKPRDLGFVGKDRMHAVTNAQV